MTEGAQQEKEGLNPELLLQLSFSHVPSSVLTAGVTLGVFSHIAAGNSSVEEISRAADASQRGMQMLVDALVGLQLLIKSGDKYELTPISAEFLVSDRPNYIGEMLRMESADGRASSKS